MKTVKDIDVKNKKVIIREDYNVPVKNGKVQESFRLEKSLPTIQYLLKNNAEQIILISHMGRPEGKKVHDLSLAPVAQKLAKLLKINFISDGNINLSEDLKIKSFKIGDKITLLENIRFFPQEESDDVDFAKKLATLGDIFVFDGFGVAHRAAASTTGLAKILPTVAGFLIEEELNNLNKILHESQKPFVFILGGAKIEEKLPVIRNLYTKSDVFLVGGAVANTFLCAKNLEIGKSLVEPKMKRKAGTLMEMILNEIDKDIYIPQDIIVSEDTKKSKNVRRIERDEIQSQDFIVDVGQKTLEFFEQEIAKAGTILWNGTMGIAEINEFSNGTKKIAEAVVKSQAVTIVGGGDTVAAIEKWGMIDKFSFVSTGGGAMLEYLSGKSLPGIEILK
jgi:phosphoglycerate kinase